MPRSFNQSSAPPAMPNYEKEEAAHSGGLPVHAWASVKNGHCRGPGEINQHRALKTAGKALLMAGRSGVGVATALAPTAFGAALGLGTQMNVVAAAGAIAAGAAVSATGVGLAAAGAAATLAQSAVAAKSLVSTVGHINKLSEIQSNLGKYALCEPTFTARDAAVYHQFIADKVLPYIIQQKKEKAVKKGMGIVPGATPFTILYAGVRKATKGDQKKAKRTFYAHVLAEHLITCDCYLAKEIVTELMGSIGDMLELMHMDLDHAAPFLWEKMRSY